MNVVFKITVFVNKILMCNPTHVYENVLVTILKNMIDLHDNIYYS